jgi:hypothetical protein
MKRKLEMDDIRIGMYITILKGKTEERMIPGPHGPIPRKRERDHYNGKVLEVINILMPYIAVNVHDRRGCSQDTIDLRQVQIMSLTDAYIQALLPNLELKREPFWDEIESASLEEADSNFKKRLEALNHSEDL